MKQLYRLLILVLILPTLVFGQQENQNSLDGQFANPTNLTDKQMNDAKNFVHQGAKDRVYKEKCAAINDCKDEEGFPLEMIIGKAYAMLGLFTGNGGMMPTLKMKDAPATGGASTGGAGGASTGGAGGASTGGAGGASTGGAGGAGGASTGGAASGGEAAKKDKPDYCMMISMAYESVGGMIQQAMQKKAENTQAQGDGQLQALVSLQETHKARMKTAKFQSYIYGGVTACYIGMMWTGIDATSPSFMLKLGGAAALTGLYIRKANKHKKAADKVGEVIASLDLAGKNCNPWTKSACFCSEKTSKDFYPAEFQEVCVLNKGNFETPKIALGCTAVESGKVQFDKECKCKATNSCMKANLKAYSPQFGLGTNMMAEANKIFDTLGTGDLDQGELDRASLKQAAMASNIKIKGSDKIKAPELTPDQKKIAEDLKQYMPANLAAVGAAATPSNRSGINDGGLGTAAMSKLPPSVKEKLAEAISVGYKTNSGDSSSSSRGSEPDFTMPSFGQQEAAAQEGTEVLTFAEKAISKADVSNAPSTPIFDIISNRYRRSGWSKLDTEGK